ncbi:hypothetical protein HQ587_08490 [bacterium]|nr:hypothetical protein [bacterium]
MHRSILYPILILAIFFLYIVFDVVFNSNSVPVETPATVRLVITGNMMGAIKECKCPSGQPGGLARRKIILESIKQEMPLPVLIECGSLTDEEIKPFEAELFTSLMVKSDYDIICSYITDLNRLLATHPDPTSVGKLPLMMNNLMSVEKQSRNNLGDKHGSITLTGYPSADESQAGETPWISNLNQTYLMILTFTHMSKLKTEQDILLENDYNLLNWQQFGDQIKQQIDDYRGLTGLVYNWQDRDDEIPLFPADIRTVIPGIDLVIIGGTALVEPEVKSEDGLLTIQPGIYGEYVLIVDLWSENRVEISRFEWEVIPTETVLPDSTFQSIIDSYYSKLEISFE